MTVMVAGTSERMLVARVGSEYFAFRLADVLEAVDAPVIAPVPLMPRGVLGQITHRGQLLPVLDPRAVLGVAREGVGREGVGRDGAACEGTVLVMVPAGTPFALGVDDVTDMITVDAGATRALPTGVDRTGILTGLLAIDHMLVGAVDIAAFRTAAGSLLTTGMR